jgi:hypothetical protein
VSSNSTRTWGSVCSTRTTRRGRLTHRTNAGTIDNPRATMTAPTVPIAVSQSVAFDPSTPSR